MYVTISDQDSEYDLPHQLTERTSCLPETRLKPEAHLFREADTVERIYQVISGAVSLTRLLEDGRRQIIAFGFPGDIVGFPCDGRYHTDCVALNEVRLQPYRLSQLDSGRINSKLGAGLLQAALHEIAAMQDHFMMLGRKSATEKVAAFLTVLKRRTGTEAGKYTQIDLPMSRADIADFLGLTTETVSRTISQFRKSRLIALDGAQTVIILREDALKALAEEGTA
ncbi:MAG: helix-turn-helix domain-containing protein [Boseongicola sp.]|nr:helix-turn-helix domain-containing protein [Boseongicola sp.]